MSTLQDMITAADPKAAVAEWFRRLDKNCAAVDYAAPRPIFADDVVFFGTRADIVSGLDLLQLNQWEGIWPNIEDFKINLDNIHADGDQNMAWGVATWTSTGFNEDGTFFSRPGRATTTILERRDGAWVSVQPISR